MTKRCYAEVAAANKNGGRGPNNDSHESAATPMLHLVRKRPSLSSHGFARFQLTSDNGCGVDIRASPGRISTLPGLEVQTEKRLNDTLPRGQFAQVS
jgi:hypothetical protein